MKELFSSILLFLFVISSSLSIAQNEFSERPTKVNNSFYQGVMTIKLKEGVGDYQEQNGMVYFGISSLDEIVQEFGVYRLEKMFSVSKKMEEKSSVNLSRIYTLYYNEDHSLRKIVKAFSTDPNIAYAEGVPMFSYCEIPDDADYDECDHLTQVMSEEAWDIHKGEDGTEEVVIAIVDSGTEWTHEDLIDNVWQNLGEDADGDGHTIEEINGEWVLDPGDLNGIDDDDQDEDPDTFIDDLIGWDIFQDANGGDASNPDAYPGLPGEENSYSHGTQCTGALGATTNNTLGVASLAYNLKYLPVAIGSYDIDIFTYGYQGVVYAATMGADIISCSWATLSESQAGFDAVTFAKEQGSIVVAGAGNNSTEYYNYPASYLGVISVANVDPNDVKWHSSTYNCAVDISAPGSGFYTTDTDNDYYWYNGTSYSTPLVAAALGLLKSYHPTWTNEQLIERVIVSADYIYDLNPNYLYKLGSGRLNAYQMLNGDTIESPNIKLGLSKLIALDQDGDNIIEAGETVGLNIDIRNFSQLYGADNATFTLSSGDADISIVEGEMTGDVPADTIINLHDVFEISIAADAEYHIAELLLHSETDVDLVKGADISIYIAIEAGGCFVYDGVLDGADFSGSYIYDYLEANGYEVYYASGDEFPSSLVGFEAVFLSYGNYESGSRTFINSMSKSVEDFLDSGGDVYIEGADHFGFDQISNYSLFEMFGLDDVIDATLEENDIDSLSGLAGSIADGLLFTDNTQEENGWIDVYFPSDEGIAAFEENDYGIVGVQYDAGSYQTFSFAYAISKLVDDSTNTRDELFQRILNFFDHTTGLNEIEESDPFSIRTFPNPTSTGTTIRYNLHNANNISIEIMNSQGQLVEQQKSQFQAQGQHEFYWNAEDLPAGVYYYSLRSDSHKSTGKIIVF